MKEKTSRPSNQRNAANPRPKRKSGDYYHPRRTKYVTFDEAKRNDYLTGFHKRKLERQKKYIESTERQAKEERKRVKRELEEERKKRLQLLRKNAEIEKKNLSTFMEMGDKLVSVESIDL